MCFYLTIYNKSINAETNDIVTTINEDYLIERHLNKKLIQWALDFEFESNLIQ